MYTGEYVYPPLTIRYHGENVGPNWSCNRVGASVADCNSTPVDRFDWTGRGHDRMYATGYNRKRADYWFYHQNIGRGVKRSAAALVVGMQGLLRPEEKINKRIKMAPMYKRSASTDLIPYFTPQSRGRQMQRVASRSRSVSYVPIPRDVSMRTRRSRSRSRSRSVPRLRYPNTRRLRRIKKKGTKRGGKRMKKNYQINNQSKGTLMTYEFGGQINDVVESFYIGHSTHAYDLIGFAVFRAFLKTLFKKMGVQILNWDEPATGDQQIIGGDRFRVTYRYQENTVSGETLDNVEVTITTGTKTFYQLALEWWDLYKVEVFRENHQFVKLEFIPVGTLAVNRILQYVTINLQKAMIHLDIKSTFKIQNISKNIADDNNEMDAVDRVPLYGLQYYGVGNGSTLRGNYQNIIIPTVPGVPGTSALNFLANFETGVIRQNGSAHSILKEPLPGKNFKEVRSSSKVTIPPGGIKTSVVNHSGGISLDRLFQHLIPENTLTKSIMNDGKFCMFGLEKVMDSNNNLFDLAYEHNYSIGCFLKTKQTYISLPLFEKLLLA